MELLTLLILLLSNVESHKNDNQNMFYPSEYIVNEIRSQESLRLTSYWDVDAWAIGYGHRLGVREGQTITEAQAEVFLREDILETINRAKRFIKVWEQLPFSSKEALTMFFYSVAYNPSAGHTLHSRINADWKDAQIFYHIQQYRKGGGKVLGGLVKRRAFEADHYFQDIPFPSNTGSEPIFAGGTGSVAVHPSTVPPTLPAKDYETKAKRKSVFVRYWWIFLSISLVGGFVLVGLDGLKEEIKGLID